MRRDGRLHLRPQLARKPRGRPRQQRQLQLQMIRRRLQLTRPSRQCCCSPSRVAVAGAAPYQHQTWRLHLRLHPRWLGSETTAEPAAAAAACGQGDVAAAGDLALAPAAGTPAPPAQGRRSRRPARGGGMSTARCPPRRRRGSGPGSRDRRPPRTSACSARSRGRRSGACRRCRLGAAARRAAGRRCRRLLQVDLRVDRRSLAAMAAVVEAVEEHAPSRENCLRRPLRQPQLQRRQ